MTESLPGQGAQADVLRLVRPDLREMPSYEAVEPIDVVAQRLGIPEEQIAKLDGNENPYGSSPGVQEALARFSFYHLYPDPQQRRLRQAIGQYVGVDAQHIVMGNGSDDLLDIIARLFISPGDGVVDAPPSFPMYSFIARICGGRLMKVPRREDFSLDIEGLAEAVHGGAKLVFLASPNNPTGNAISPEELERLLATGAIVVIDEAYAEFAGESFAPLVPRHDNLMVVRTFSKWAGLAGLRAGYGVLPKTIAELILKVKMPYNLNVAAQAAVLASLEERDTLQERVRAIVAERERLFQDLSSIPWLRPYPSRANFLLCRVEGVEAREVWRRLQSKGIFIRYIDTRLLRNCLRISVGRPEHTDRLLEALRQIGEALGD